METYDPASDSTLITIVEESEEPKKTVPTGLLRSEKKVDDDQMADFSSPIEEVMPPPPQMEYQQQQQPLMIPGLAPVPRKKKAANPNPFGLTDDQYMAAIAGLAAVVAFSGPVQGKLSTFVPKFLEESGKHTMTGLVVTAVVAALVYYFIRKFAVEKN